MLARLMAAAITFFLPLGLARLLDPSGFGTYKQLFLVVQTILLVGQLGLTQSLYYFLPSGGRDRGAYLAQALVVLGLLAVVFGTAVWFGAPWLGGWLGDGSLTALRTPLALLAAGMLLASPLEGSLTSEGRVGTSALVYLLGDAARAGLLLGGALAGGIVGLTWGGALFVALRIVALMSLIGTGILPLAPPAWLKLRAQLIYALPFAGAVLFHVAQRQFAQYAVSAHFDAPTFAIYSVAMFHYPVVDILYAPIAEVLMLQLGRLRAQLPEVGPPAGPSPLALASLVEWDDAVEKLAFVLWPGAALAWVLGPRLLPLLFTTKYIASVPLFLIATSELLLWVFPVDALLRARGETRFLFAWNVVRAGLTPLLVLGGIHVGGIAGAIVGSILSEALSRGVTLHRGQRSLGAGRSLLSLARLGPIAGAAALAALPAWAVLRGLEGLPGLVSAAGAYSLAYLGLYLLYRRRRRSGGDAGAVPAHRHTKG